MCACCLPCPARGWGRVAEAHVVGAVHFAERALHPLVIRIHVCAALIRMGVRLNRRLLRHGRVIQPRERTNLVEVRLETLHDANGIEAPRAARHRVDLERLRVGMEEFGPERLSTPGGVEEGEKAFGRLFRVGARHGTKGRVRHDGDRVGACVDALVPIRDLQVRILDRRERLAHDCEREGRIQP